MARAELSSPLSPALAEIYRGDLTARTRHHEKMSRIVRELPSSVRVLYVETSPGGFLPAHSNFNKLHSERRRLINLAQSGNESPKTTLHAENFRYLLGFKDDDPRFVVWDAAHGEEKPDPTKFDALIIGGSEMMVTSLHDDPEARDNIWMRRILGFLNDWDHTKPGLYVCFGHQLEAYRRGGKIDWMTEEGVKKKEVGLVEIFMAEGAKHPLIQGFSKNMTTICATHSQHVSEAPASATVLASNNMSPNQMLGYGDSEVSIQNHPEITRGLIHTKEALGSNPRSAEMVEQQLFAEEMPVLEYVVFENLVNLLREQTLINA